MKKSMFVLMILALALSAAPALAVECVTKDKFVMCKTEQAFDLMTDSLMNQDKALFGKLILSGQCVPTKAGQKVILKHQGMFSGKCRIRPMGSAGEMWTNSEAVECR